MYRLGLRLIRSPRQRFDLRLDGLRSAGLTSLTGRVCVDRTFVNLERGSGRAVNRPRWCLCRVHHRLRRGIVRRGRRSPEVWSGPRISLHGSNDLRCWTRLERSHCWPIRLRSGRAYLRYLGRNCSNWWSLLLIWSAAVGVNSGILQLRVNRWIVLLR